MKRFYQKSNAKNWTNKHLLNTQCFPNVSFWCGEHQYYFNFGVEKLSISHTQEMPNVPMR